MPILILKEKHGDRHFSFSNDNELGLLARYVIQERIEEGWYDDAEQPSKLQRALEDPKVALSFLHSRNRYEYEGFEIVEPETTEGLNL